MNEISIRVKLKPLNKLCKALARFHEDIPDLLKALEDGVIKEEPAEEKKPKDEPEDVDSTDDPS